MIVVLNEGTMMTIQAVVSNDRRYVRLTVVPFFTQVGDVDTFTFEGTDVDHQLERDRPTTTRTARTNRKANPMRKPRTGVTVQLPAFQFIAVVTTVSVPDGGTVLLGGIKRLSEGRNEFGVPLLSKVPYVNRLFRNVGIGRDDGQPDDDGHAADHHPGRGRRTPRHHGRRPGHVLVTSLPRTIVGGYAVGMSPNRWIAVGAILGAIGVALGAYGAHGLDKQLAAWGYAGDDLAKRLANHETAVRYQMWHALAIVLVGIGAHDSANALVAGVRLGLARRHADLLRHALRLGAHRPQLALARRDGADRWTVADRRLGAAGDRRLAKLLIQPAEPPLAGRHRLESPRAALPRRTPASISP